jgi:hypothetical protein
MSQLNVDNIARQNGLQDSNAASVGISVSASLVPTQDDTYNLGASAQRWKDLYIDGTASIDYLDVNSGVRTDLSPEGYGHNLGSSGAKWYDLFLDGTATVDAIQASSGSITQLEVGGLHVTGISSSLIPTTNKTNTLGTPTRQFRSASIEDVVVSGKVYASGSNAKIIPGSNQNNYFFQNNTTGENSSMNGFRVEGSLVVSANQNYSASFGSSGSIGYSGSYAGNRLAVRFQNLPSSEALARHIGTGSLWLSGSSQNSQYLMVFTG